MTTAGRPPVDNGDHHLGHGADQSLHFQDVQATALGLHPGGIDSVSGVPTGVLVAGPPADSLIAAAAEGPAAVLFAGAVARQQDDSHIWAPPGVIEGTVELVHRVWAKSVAHLGTIKRDPDNAVDPAFTGMPVIGDVGQIVETVDYAPLRGIKRLIRWCAHGD